MLELVSSIPRQHGQILYAAMPTNAEDTDIERLFQLLVKFCVLRMNNEKLITTL